MEKFNGIFNEAAILIVKQFWLIGIVLLVLLVCQYSARRALISLRTIKEGNKAEFKNKQKPAWQNFGNCLTSVLLWLWKLASNDSVVFWACSDVWFVSGID